MRPLKFEDQHGCCIIQQHYKQKKLDVVIQRNDVQSTALDSLGNELSTPEVSSSTTVEDAFIQDDGVSLQSRFARWDWKQRIQDFPWRASGTLDLSGPWFAQHTTSDLSTFFNFTRALAWKVGDAFCTSYMELAFLFHKTGFVLEACSGDGITFRDLSYWLRRLFVYIK